VSGYDERLGSAREEAERLVAAGLGWVSTALHGVEANRQLRVLAEQVLDSDRVHDLAAGLAGFVSGVTPGAAGGSESPGPGLSTGSADCCVCPVCRAIGALRDPGPEFAERLASAVGDVAVGISGLLRALSGTVPRPGHRTAEDPWHAATTAPESTDTAPRPESEGAQAPSAPASGEAGAAPAKRVAKKAVAKKTVAKKTVAKKAAAKKTVAGKTDAQKVAAKRVTAKKAVRKAVPKDPDDGPA
jgi:hypothetical protein